MEFTKILNEVDIEVDQENDFAQKLKEMQEEVNKIKHLHKMPSVSPPLVAYPNGQTALSLEEKQACDAKSVFVGNVDYSATPQSLERHFQNCGKIERVTILSDKFRGTPKGLAYIEFAELTGKGKALALDKSFYLGRQLKVTEKRTNKPGIGNATRLTRGMVKGNTVPRGAFGTGRQGEGPVKTIVKYVYPNRGRRGPRRGCGYKPF
ncbi:unnamed protein product [Bursaphelenchus okinawaensis]|uniref:RRM domain-containing protein n=1 Tax=Bursaphelenchus okinawaensis TaxID=465554 RepID=A0A811KXK0_9BILA|nr:unnamed protein product [Bursaphelenchus okinawaensis]CAG9113887.1 unnamed protein product [Bursaphelenchus okinawaensis]